MHYWSGLVVMGGDSCPEGRGFKYQNRILVGHFFHKNIGVTIVIFVGKINEKEAVDWPIFMNSAFTRGQTLLMQNPGWTSAF